MFLTVIPPEGGRLHLVDVMPEQTEADAHWPRLGAYSRDQIRLRQNRGRLRLERTQMGPPRPGLAGVVAGGGRGEPMPQSRPRAPCGR